MRDIDKLCNKSIEVILNNQSKNGLYVACPNFENYRYCWLRDGTFIAYSLDISNHSSSSSKYYTEINQIINSRELDIKLALEKYKKNKKIFNKNILPTRFTLNGEINEDGWPNFQLDGYGTWLWGLVEHLKITKSEDLLNKVFKKSVALIIKYLSLFWDKENYDCWEENGDKIHSSTIGCIYSGLKSINSLIDDDNLFRLTIKIKNYLLKNCIKNNYIVKFIGSDLVDSSLLWLLFPFRMFNPEDILIINTITKIEKDLCNKGLKRYLGDSYYGGGVWPLLTAQLGCCYVLLNKIDKAEELLLKVTENADINFLLPEQIPININSEKYFYWKNKWGDIAKPLLWSHAMYVILYCLLQRKRNNTE